MLGNDQPPPAPIVNLPAPVVNLPAPEVTVNVEPPRARSVRVEEDPETGERRYVVEEEQ